MIDSGLIIKAKESGLRSCYGLGEVKGQAVSWLCTGHRSDYPCSTAWVMIASESDHFIDEESDTCFIIQHKKVVRCRGKCVGTWDVEGWPSRSVNDGTVSITQPNANLYEVVDNHCPSEGSYA